MSIPGRWVRLDVGCFESEWVIRLSPVAQLCWVRLLLHVKTSGNGGKVKRLGPLAVERLWSVPQADLASMEEAAIEDGALAIEAGQWVVTGWAKYQEVDGTAAIRQRRFRARKKGENPWAGESCELCGADENLTTDHILPKSLGGSNDPSNLRTLCRTCNSTIGNDLSHPLRQSRVISVTPIVDRNDPLALSRATETLTLTEEQKKTHKPKRVSWRICPDGWEPSDKHRDLAGQLHVSLDAELTRFREWEFKDPKSDPDKAFFRWLRKAGEMAGNGNGNGSSPKGQQYRRLLPDPT